MNIGNLPKDEKELWIYYRCHRPIQSLNYHCTPVALDQIRGQYSVEASALTEVSFDYITGEYNDGGKIFKKRK